MRIEVSEQPLKAFEEYASVPIWFEVNMILDVSDSNASTGGFDLKERLLDNPYIKDYDAIEGAHPSQWPKRFDVSNWGVFTAYIEERPIGRAVIALDTPGMDMLEGQRDLAVLWDIRVSPEVRGKGVGSALFRAAELWAKERGCQYLKVETQNINVAACKFYARQGCTLLDVNRVAYSELPDEIQLLWYKIL